MVGYYTNTCNNLVNYAIFSHSFTCCFIESNIDFHRIEYPTLNDSLISLKSEYKKARIGDYVPTNLSKTNTKKDKNGRNSTKKFLRDARAQKLELLV